MEHSLIRILPVGLTDALPEGWDYSQPGYLIEVVPTLEDATTLAQFVADIEPDVVLIDADAKRGDAFEWTRLALEVQPGLAVVMLSRDATPENERRAMMSGAEEFLSKNLDASLLNAAIIQVASQRTLRQIQLTPTAEKNANANVAAPSMEGRVIGIVAGKGGLGKTTVAANLALLAARTPPKSAALVGLDTGDGAILLNLQPRLGLIDLAGGAPDNDAPVYTAEWIKQFSTRHKSGLHYWTWNGSATQNIADPPENFFPMLFAALRDAFAITIVDFPVLLADEAAQVLPLLDSVIVVSSTSDLLALRSTKTFLDIMSGCGVQNANVIINRADAGDMITREDFELTLGRKVSGVISNQPALTAEAINMGAPVVLMQPQSGIAADLRDIARGVLQIPVEDVTVEKKKLFGIFG